MDHYTLYEEDVPPSRFDEQHSHYKTRSDVLRGCFVAEKEAPKSLQNGEANAEQTNHAITQPIATSPVHTMRTYSDGIIALTHLWRLYRDALIQWPSKCTPDLVALGSTISNLPDHVQVHRGRAVTQPEDELLVWKDLPFLGMEWSDARQMGHA